MIDHETVCGFDAQIAEAKAHVEMVRRRILAEQVDWNRVETEWRLEADEAIAQNRDLPDKPEPPDFETLHQSLTPAQMQVTRHAEARLKAIVESAEEIEAQCRATEAVLLDEDRQVLDVVWQQLAKHTELAATMVEVRSAQEAVLGRQIPSRVDRTIRRPTLVELVQAVEADASLLDLAPVPRDVHVPHAAGDPQADAYRQQWTPNASGVLGRVR